MSQFTAYPQFFDFSTPASASEPVSIGKDSPDFITSEWLNDGGDLPSQPAQNHVLSLNVKCKYLLD